MKIGLFFGSFNPFHIGHLIIANHIIEYTDIQKIWFIVSPHNPFKNSLNLLEGKKRLIISKLSIKGYKNMMVSDIEFKLPKPSYTIDTLKILKKKYPKKCFRLIIGEDLIQNFSKWKEYNILINQYKIYVYPRLPSQFFKSSYIKIIYIKAPLIEISSSFIRSCIKEGKNIRPFLLLKSWEYIIRYNLYK